MNKKRQRIVLNPSSVDDLLARADTATMEPVKTAKTVPLVNETAKPQKTKKPKEQSGLLSAVNLSLAGEKTSTSYNISDSLLLALDQACLELKAGGVRRAATGRKVTRGHLVEVALLHALQTLQKEGLQAEVATLLVDM